MEHSQKLTSSDHRWYKIIQQCRTSGKSDYQWLQEHDIKSSTFYYHVKQLREKACVIPEATRVVSKPEVQEVVPVSFGKEDVAVSNTSAAAVFTEQPDNQAAIRLRIHGVSIEISNSVSQNVIQNTLSALQSLC